VFVALFINGAALCGEFYSFVGSRLATIDIATGTATSFPNNTGVGQPPGLDFRPGTGVLFGANGGWLRTFDLVTGIGTSHAELWYDYDDGIPKPNSFVCLAFAPNGVLYGAINGNSWLYRIEPDGEVVPLAPLSKSLSTSGMDFASDGTLFIVDGGADSAVYTVNMATGVLTLFADIPTIGATDLAVTEADTIYVSAGVGSSTVIYEVDALGVVTSVTTSPNINPAALGYGPTPLYVDIDIKPGSYPNSFNIDGNGVVPVAILGSPHFDVAQIDQTTLDFAGLAARVKGNGQPQCSIEDTNGDGFDDLVCQFVDDASLWSPGEDEATLSGLLLDGTYFEGSDTINILP
jgi:hypothetical protein